MNQLENNEVDLRLVRTWMEDAAQIALLQRDLLSHNLKDDGTPVTDVDRKIEALLVERIVKYYPGHQILAEEGGNQKTDSEFMWIIDPIDGTRAYLSGLPIWGISVGIFRRGEPYAGLFLMPNTGDMYWGMNGKAFYNDKPLSSRKNSSLQTSLAFIAAPSNAHLEYEIHFRRLRSFGSAAAHLAYVAHGVAFAALTRRIYIWDVAAILPILNATDVKMTYLSGKAFESNDLLNGDQSPEPLIAAPCDAIDEVRALIHRREASPPASR